MKTAIDWFAGEIKGGKLITNQKFEELLQQAKEIFEQQIIDAFEIGYENGACVNENNDFYHGGNYYKETFKQQEL